MKILVHTDSAFDSLFFMRYLRKEQWEVLGYFYNPNIQPYSEYHKCMLMQKLLGVLEDIIMIYPQKYDFEEYLKGISVYDHQKNRCKYCYSFALEHTAKYAKKLKIPYFTTTWLLNPNHDHKLLKSLGDAIGVKYGLKFFFQDLAKQWETADQIAVKMNLYEQPYCGCIFSERYHYYPMTLPVETKSKAKKSSPKNKPVSGKKKAKAGKRK
ncbi:epoxyqueuosine reductase QueH [Candidatus Margulisiibacteriota bacterium]